MAGKKKLEKESLATFRRITRYDQMIASGTYPSVKKLIAEFETSEATVHRDLEALRNDFGAKKYLKYDRFKGGYYYSNPTFRIPALITTEKQIIAAQLVSNLLDMIKGTPLYKQAVEVFTTLSSNIEQDSKLNAKKLSNRILFLGMNPVEIKDETWSFLEEAMSKNRYITFDYKKGDHTYNICLKPYQLIYSNGVWTLYGYRTNPGYEGNKFFNLPFIYNIIIREETFDLPEDFSYEKHVAGNFGRYIGEENYEFKIKILANWKADYLKTYSWAPDQSFEEQPDGTEIMTFTSNQYYPVLDWVLEQGKYVKPLAPQKLVDDWTDNVINMMKMVEKINNE